MGSAPRWHRLLGERHEYDEEWERAIRCYLVALDQEPDDLETYYRLARIYAKLGVENANLDLLEQAGKVGRAGRRRAEPGSDWFQRFDALLGELGPAWEAAGGDTEDVEPR